jgi:hypothetical protein
MARSSFFGIKSPEKREFGVKILSLIPLKIFHAKTQSAQRKIKNLAVFAALREKKHKI